jgi:hypothetical protein
VSDLEAAGDRERTDVIAHLRDTLAPAGVAPGTEQRFAIVPLSRRDSFLVPLDSRAAARRSLSEYGALRSLPKRVARQALGAAWTIGLPEVVLRGRATLPAGDDTLLGHLREVLGERALTFATGLRWVGSFYTPVLQLFRPDGTPVAYAKIGWDDVTTAQVRAESDALALVAAASTDLLHAPGLLHAGPWQHLELCVTAPLPRRAKRVPSAHLPPVLALHEVAALDGPVVTHEVRRSPWWQQILERAPALDPQAPRLVDALGQLDAEVGAVELAFGRWHGDWVAWNMAEAADGLYVWDWEYSRPGRPFGFDLLHFFFQDAFVARSQPLLSAFDDAATRAASGLLRLGLDADAQAALQRLHRLEVRLRAENAVQLGADPDPAVRDLDIFTLLAHA